MAIRNPCGRAWRRAVLPANTEKCCEFAWHHVIAVLTRRMFLHVIARSEATWQSVLLAAGHGGGQYFGQIRKALRICPK